MLNLKERRIELGLTMLEVAKLVGVSEATISRYESGNIKNMRRDRIEKYASALKVSPSSFLDINEDNDTTSPDSDLSELMQKYDNIKPIKLKRFPMLGEIACGKPIFADEDREHYIMADMDIDADFCLTAKGDSMINARIYNGDIVFIKEMPIVENGDIAAVIIEDEATLKRVYYYPDDNMLQLVAENPKYKPLVYQGPELDTIRILGRAVYFMSAVE
jgi:repressor LexA